MTVIQPGPDSIEPDTMPGGLILHCYSVPDQRLLFAHHISTDISPEALETMATVGADLAAAAATNVCLVAFDGDTGQRIPLRHWLGTDRL